MLLEKQDQWWGLAVLGAIFATLYFPYQAVQPDRHFGGSPVGLTLGIVGSALIVFAALLRERKQVRTWRIGRAHTWTRLHLWLGLLSFPIILFHSGLSLGGVLTTVLMSVFFLVVVSGLVGAVCQHYGPRLMTMEVPEETIYEQIDTFRSHLVNEADQSVANACGLLWVSGVTVFPGSREEIASQVSNQARADLRAFYLKRVRPALVGLHEECEWDETAVEGILELAPSLRPVFNSLQRYCGELKKGVDQDKQAKNLWLADRAVANAYGPLQVRRAVVFPTVEEKEAPSGELEQHRSTLRDFYLGQVRPFLRHPKAGLRELKTRARAEQLFNEKRSFLPKLKPPPEILDFLQEIQAVRHGSQEGDQPLTRHSPKELLTRSRSLLADMKVIGEVASFLESLSKRDSSQKLDESHYARAKKLLEEYSSVWASETLRATLDFLEDACEQARQLRRQARITYLLHGWLLVHVPLTAALLVLGVVHAVVALLY